MKTGVQAVYNVTRILDSGFRRNDMKRTNSIFSRLLSGQRRRFINDIPPMTGNMVS